MRLLADRGDEVIVYDNLCRGSVERLQGYVGLGVRLVVADIRDLGRLADVFTEHRPEVVMHLAAMHFIPDCDADPGECLSVNIVGTQTVMDVIATVSPMPALVYISSAAVYGPDSRPHIELESRVAPTDVYGCSKLAGEQLVEAFARRTGSSCSMARLFNVYGPDETNPHLIPTVIRQAQIGTDLHLGNLATRRDYVFTEDVARALMLLADATMQGRGLLCNVGTGEARSGQEVVTAVARLLGKDLKVVPDAERTRPSDRPDLCADVRCVREQLGWVSQVPFNDGLKRTLEQPVGVEVSWR